MARYIITYIGGDQPSSSEEGQKHFAKYKKWLVSLGDSAIEPMVPFKNAHSISSDSSVSQGSSIAMSGYTMINAESIDEAILIAKGCPFLETNGVLEVAELLQMPES